MTKDSMSRRFALPGARRLLPLLLAALACGADAADFALRLIGQQTIATGTLFGALNLAAFPVLTGPAMAVFGRSPTIAAVSGGRHVSTG